MKLSRLLAIPAVAGAMVLAQTVGISPAHAGFDDLACNYDYVHFNACLNFQDAGETNQVTAHVGLDAFMPEWYAQAIVAHGAQVRAWLWGDDGGNDHFIAELTVMPGWPAAGPSGLGAELSAANLYRGDLDEDPYDEDEIYAVVSYFDPSQGQVTYRTGTVHGEFAPMGGGGDGCLVACQ